MLIFREVLRIYKMKNPLVLPPLTLMMELPVRLQWSWLILKAVLLLNPLYANVSIAIFNVLFKSISNLEKWPLTCKLGEIQGNLGKISNIFFFNQGKLREIFSAYQFSDFLTDCWTSSQWKLLYFTQ